MGKTKRRSQVAGQDMVDLSGVDAASRDLLNITIADLPMGTFGDSLDTISRGRSGIHMPALCLRYLFGCRVWLLTRVVELFGAPGSCKSMLLGEIMRWHTAQHGRGHIIDNESKEASQLIETIVFDSELLKRIQGGSTSELQQWQQLLTFTAAGIAKSCVPKDARDESTYGPLSRIPQCIGIDPLTGTSTEESIDAIRKAGHSKREFAVEALLISKYLKALPNIMKFAPLSIVGTNHYKPTDENDKSTPGGEAYKFLSTYRIKLARHRAIPPRSDGATGLVIGVQIPKSSTSASSRKLQVKVMWHRRKDEHGQSRQYTYWDWHTATIDMLLDQQPMKKLWHEVTDVVDIHKGKGGRIYSDVLGISKEAPVPAYVAGRLLENEPRLLGQLYDIFLIAKNNIFVPGTIYPKYRDEKYRERLPGYANPLLTNDYVDFLTGDPNADANEEE